MSAKQALEVIVGASLDPRFRNAFQSADKQIHGLNKDIVELKKKQTLIKNFEIKTGDLDKAQAEIDETRTKLQALQSQAKFSPFKNLAEDLRKAKAEAAGMKSALSLDKLKLGEARQQAKLLRLEIKKNPTPELKKQLAEVNLTINQFSQKVLSGKAAVDKATASLNKVKEAAKLQGEIDKTERSLGRMTTGLDKTQNELNQIQSELKQAGIDTKNYTEENKRLDKALEQVTRRQQRFAKLQAAKQQTAQQFADMKGQGVGLAMTGVAAGGTAMPALSFEQAASNLQAKSSGITPEQRKQLEDQAKALGRDMQFTATEALQGMTFLSMAGFKAPDIQAAAPGMLNLAAASGLDLAQSADISSNILSGFGLKAKEMGRVGDVLTATFTSSNVTLDMLGETMKYVAPVASKAGASIEEVATMTGLLGNVGIQGSMAGTALRAAFTRLSAPPKAAAAALKKLGVQTVWTADQFDKSGKKIASKGDLKAMPDVLEQLYEKTKKLGTAEQADLISKIFGIEASAAMQELIYRTGQSEEGFRSLYKTVKNSEGKTTMVAKIMNDNTLGAFNRMKSAFEGFAIAAGEQFAPALTKAADSMTGLLNSTTKLIEANPAMVKGLGLVVGGLLAVKTVGFAVKLAMLGTRTGVLSLAGPVLSLLSPVSQLKTGFAAVGKVGSKLGIVGNVFSKLGTAALLLVSPIKLIKIGFSALGAVGPVLGTVARMAGLVLTAATPLGWVVRGLALAGGLLVSSWDNVGAMFSGLVQGISYFFGGIGNQLSGFIDGFVSGFGEAVAPLATAFAPVLDALQPVIDGFSSLKAGLDPVWTWLQDKTSGLIGWLFNSGHAMQQNNSDAQSWGQTIGSALGSVVTGITGFIADVNGLLTAFSPTTHFKAAFKAVFEYLDTIPADMTGIGSMIIGGLKAGITGAVDSVTESVMGVGKSIKEGFTNFFDINSPSRLMMEQGGFLMTGLEHGIGQQATAPVKAMMSMNQKLSAATTDQLPLPAINPGKMAAAATLALGINTGVAAQPVTEQFGQLQSPDRVLSVASPLYSTPALLPRQQQKQVSIDNRIGEIVIHVHGADDPRAAAEQIYRELERLQRDHANAGLYDHGEF